ncbi:uncharacterized protein PG998_008244 [Apiospora kogelbergensis]|uniref:Uncharacterized protein n=1 Tax=Apiospora kogelbergensis TaxID=1337665 RepID=A0AAW0QF81_9PEZI
MTAASSISGSKSTKKSKNKLASSPSLRAYLQQSPSKENWLAATTGPGTMAAAASNASSKASAKRMSVDIAKIMVPFNR